MRRCASQATQDSADRDSCPTAILVTRTAVNGCKPASLRPQACGFLFYANTPVDFEPQGDYLRYQTSWVSRNHLAEFRPMPWAGGQPFHAVVNPMCVPRRKLQQSEIG